MRGGGGGVKTLFKHEGGEKEAMIITQWKGFCFYSNSNFKINFPLQLDSCVKIAAVMKKRSYWYMLREQLPLNGWANWILREIKVFVIYSLEEGGAAVSPEEPAHSISWALLPRAGPQNLLREIRPPLSPSTSHSPSLSCTSEPVSLRRGWWVTCHKAEVHFLQYAFSISTKKAGPGEKVALPRLWNFRKKEQTLKKPLHVTQLADRR